MICSEDEDFTPKTAEYTFFSSACGTFSGIDHILGHKTSLNKFKIKIVPNIFSDHYGMKLEINHNKNTEKHTKTWLNNMLLNNEWVDNEIKEEIKTYIETKENENTTTQNLWHTMKVVLREKFKALEAYLKKQEKAQINNLTLHLKELKKDNKERPS